MSSILKVGNFTENFLKAIVKPKQENFVTGAKLTASVALHVGASHGHTLLITKRLSPTILMYSRHQCVMTVESQRDQMIFNPEQILGSWSKKECSILMMTRALNRVLRSK